MATCWNLDPTEPLCDPAGGRLLVFPDALPALPLMPATRLRLEILFAERTIDLAALCEAVLDDPGAALSMMRSAGEQEAPEACTGARAVEWVACLELDEWFRTAALQPAPGPAAMAAWLHARRIVAQVRALIEDAPGWDAEEVCVAALLHDLEQMPALLGWGSLPCAAGERAQYLVRALRLPRFLLRYLRDQQNPASPWAALLSQAHRLVMHAEKVA